MWRVYLSRWVNCHLLGGSPNEMLCTRVYRECWPAHYRIAIDLTIFWHKNHCERCYKWEKGHGQWRIAPSTVRKRVRTGKTAGAGSAGNEPTSNANSASIRLHRQLQDLPPVWRLNELAATESEVIRILTARNRLAKSKRPGINPVSYFIHALHYS